MLPVRTGGVGHVLFLWHLGGGVGSGRGADAPFFVAPTAAAPIRRLDFREPVLLPVSLTCEPGNGRLRDSEHATKTGDPAMEP